MNKSKKLQHKRTAAKWEWNEGKEEESGICHLRQGRREGFVNGSAVLGAMSGHHKLDAAALISSARVETDQLLLLFGPEMCPMG